VTQWGGRKVRRLITLVLFHKGRICHLCGEDGADSADHDPPRSVLVRERVPNPDALVYLWPAHLLCNFTRHDRPLSDAVREECKAKRRALRGEDSPTLSPSLARRRRLFETD